MTEVTRSPQGLVETITANCRPQPAIPAVLVMLLTLLLTMSVSRDGTAAGWVVWLVPAGLLVSAGLAVGAGFCSLFPQVAWLLLAGWALPRLAAAGLPSMTPYVAYAGMAAAVVMLFVQVWRIATARFIPTITEPEEGA